MVRFVLALILITMPSLVKADEVVQLSSEELQFLQNQIQNAPAGLQPALTTAAQGLTTESYFTLIASGGNFSSDSPGGTTLNIMALLEASPNLQDPKAISIQQKLIKAIFLSVPGVTYVDSPTTFSGKSVTGDVMPFYTREEDLLIGTIRKIYGAGPQNYLDFKNKVYRLHNLILGWFDRQTEHFSPTFLQYVYVKAFGGEVNTNEIKARFEALPDKSVSANPAPPSDSSAAQEALSAQDLSYLDSLISIFETTYQAGMKSYLEELKKNPQLTFVPAYGDYKKGKPTGTVLVAMAVLDGAANNDPAADAIYKKIVNVVFSGIPNLEDRSDTFSLKAPNTEMMKSAAAHYSELKPFFTREEELLIGTFRYRYGSAAPSYGAFKEGVERLHNRILGWFGIQRNVNSAFLEFLYVNIYGQPEGVSLKGEFGKYMPLVVATNAAPVNEQPGLMQFDPNQLTMGQEAYTETDTTQYLMNALAGRPAIKGQQDVYTDKYLGPYLMALLKEKTIPADTTLEGVVRTVEKNYEAEWGTQDKNIYQYQWLLLTSELEDPQAAANSCVKRISESGYGVHLQKDWDWYSVLMKTRTKKHGVREDKRHICGMIFAEVVGTRQ